MGTVGRVTALVTALLLLHLTMAGSSGGCLTSEHGAAGPGNDHSEISITTPIPSASDTNHSVVESHEYTMQLGVSAEQQASTPEGSRCPAHHTTGPCDWMAACTTAALAPAVVGMSVVVAPNARAIPWRVLTPPTRTTTPELPPPRA